MKILYVNKYRLAHIRATKTYYFVFFAGHINEKVDQSDKIKQKFFIL